MILDPAMNPIEILPQPVVLKPHTRIRIGLRCGLVYQRLDGFDFMDDPRQYFSFTICISICELNRQRGAKQP